MTDRDRRRTLRDEARQHPPSAGVYAIRNRVTGRVLVASTLNLTGMSNRFAFAKATGSVGAIDGRLAADIREHGVEALDLEILETVAVTPATGATELATDLAALEELWAEKLAGNG